MKTEVSTGVSESLSEWLSWGMSELSFLSEREARRECEEILETLLGISRIELYLTREVDRLLFPQFSQWIEARKKRIPLAYLLRKAYFWGELFEMEDGVLIPRPETEVMIDSFLKKSGFSRQDSFSFLDLGTGSGNIAIIIAKLFPRARGLATDISEQALSLAQRNAGRLKIERKRLHFLQADLFSGFGKVNFDVIFSNPPYVSSDDWCELEPEVKKEPWLALNGGQDGLDFYRRIFDHFSFLKRGGSLWLEVGIDESGIVRSLFEKKDFARTQIFKDLNKIDRVVTGLGFNG
ncbi:MAG: peptide chain release factor N(5)-glutamine methyltransferase [Candidatus Omnitrophica bacterium]|nr:peptide chain release factor N(5)-glutamine methyltransferase [Candidatus Omnitrophota bacterium]